MNLRAMAKMEGPAYVPRNFFLAASSAACQSQPVHQITRTCAHSLGNSQKSVHRHRAVAIFKQGKKNNGKSGTLGKSLLGQPRLFAGFTDCFTQCSTVFRNGRHALYKQERPRNDIYYSIILFLRNFRIGRKTSLTISKTNGFMSEKIKVLLAEHEMPLAMWMISLLTQAGCDVQPVFSGNKAITLASETRFDLIILETNLSGVNGYDVCRDLKQRHISWRTPIVFVSANSSIENQQYALEIGAADFIERPFIADEFISRILSCLHEPSDFPDQHPDANPQGLCNPP